MGYSSREDAEISAKICTNIVKRIMNFFNWK